jgi:DNA-binding transcriptional LysR family regulator
MSRIHRGDDSLSTMSLIDRVDFADLRLFLAIVRTRSFKAAAIQLGLSPSAASHAMRRLEARLGVKLLNRSARSVTPTDIGLELAKRLGDGFDAIGAALGLIDSAMPAHGELRINVFADAAHLLIEPAIVAFAHIFPDVRLTVVVEDRPIDIVEEGYAAGVRYGDYVPEDMVAVPLSGPQRWVVAAAPAYLAKYGAPAHPDDLAQHRCLQLLLGDNSAYKWEFDIDGVRRRIRVPGSITINDTATTIAVAKAGAGLAYLLESRIAGELAEGSLRIVLDAFAARGEPFHMYYSSRRHSHPALRTLINIIRVRQSLPPVG